MNLTRRSPFLRACALGDVEEVERLLDYGEGIDQTDTFGYSAVHIAILNRNLPLLRLLAGRGADMRMPAIYDNRPTETLCELAIKSNFLEGLKFIVDEMKLPLFTVSMKNNHMLLFHALKDYNAMPMLRYLVEKKNLNPRYAVTKDGYTLLHEAEDNDVHPAVIEYLLAKGADPRTDCPRMARETDDPETAYLGLPIVMAAWKGDSERVNLYLRYGVNPYQKNGLGKDALSAVEDYRNPNRNRYKGDFAQIPELIHAASRGAQLPDSRRNRFVMACASDDLDEVYRLLKADENPDQMDVDGMSGIHVAMESRNLELLELLTHFGADPYLHIGNKKKNLNVMELGIEEGFVDGLRYLDQERGVKLTPREDQKLDNLLFHAFHRTDNILTLRWLIEEKMLDPSEAVDAGGHDLLMESERSNSVLTYTEYLLQAGMDPNEESPPPREKSMAEIDIYDSETPHRESYSSLPLVRASYNAEPDLADLYLEYKADPLKWDRNNNTAWDALSDHLNPNLEKYKTEVWYLREVIRAAADRVYNGLKPPNPPLLGFVNPSL